MTAWFLLLAACGSKPDTGPGDTAGASSLDADADTDADSDSDTDTDADTDADADADTDTDTDTDADTDTDTDTEVDPLTVDDDGDGASEVGGDCDDADASIGPHALEVCDLVDQDCDGVVDEGTECFDDDDDGFTELAGDCDDADAATYPGAVDLLGDALDQDCDGSDGVDGDRDGFASEASGGDDCDDADATVFPGAPEVWYDGVDQPCDGLPDSDQDGDGQAAAILGGPDCDDTDPLVWAPTLAWSNPAAGDAGWYWLDPLQLEVPAEQADVVVPFLDGPDGPVAVTVSRDGARFTLTPGAPLSPSTDYTLGVEAGCGVVSARFTTSATGGRVDPWSLVGRAWAADPASGTLLSPASLAAVFRPYWSGSFLIGVVSTDGVALDLRFGRTEDGSADQDRCGATTEAYDAFAGNPTLAARGGDASMPGPITMYGWAVDGVFPPDGARIERLTVSGFADARDVYAALGGTDAASLCDFLAASGVPCEACADGSVTCVPLIVGDLEAVEVPGPALPFDAAAIALDPACR